MHSVTFPTNKGKQRKKYQLLSSNYKLKFSKETFLTNIFKNFLRLSSFFIFFAIPCSDFIATDMASKRLHNPASNSGQSGGGCTNVNAYDNTNSYVELDKKDYDSKEEDCFECRKCFSLKPYCLSCGNCYGAGYIYKDTTCVRMLKYLSFFLFGIVVVVVINRYMDTNSSVVEIKDGEIRERINRKKKNRSKRRQQKNKYIK